MVRKFLNMSHEIVFQVFDAQKHSPELKLPLLKTCSSTARTTTNVFTMADLTCRYGTVPDMRDIVIYDLKL